MIRRHITVFHVALALIDAGSALVVFAIAARLRFGPAGWDALIIGTGWHPLLLATAFALLWTVAIWLQDLYRLRSRWSTRGMLDDIVRAAILLAVATFGALFLFKLPDISRSFLLLLFLLQFVVTVTSRLTLRLSMAYARRYGHFRRHILFVGTGREARDFAHRLDRHRELGLHTVGYLTTPSAQGSSGLSGPILGTIDDLEEVLHTHVVDEVAICLSHRQAARIEAITQLCEEEGRVVRIPLGDRDATLLPAGRVEDFEGIRILSLVYGPDRWLGLAAKRLTDIVLSIVAMILASPLFVIIACMVLVFDGRPILFRQTRVGLRGRTFSVVKFRTMVPDAETLVAELKAKNEVSGCAFKMTNDPRLTRIGRWLRKTSLDELPQFWNVLRGQMSIVGPRPPLRDEVRGYDVWHRRRLSMKPGITGLWQVSARNEADFDRWVEIDLDYIDRWSYWLDWRIMLRTVPAMLEGR